jgi:mersacidin/lichenicidin family type 2 lantibiotic
MSNTEIVRAWKDPEYRATLSQVPPLPIGSIELDDPYLSEHTFVSKVFASRRGEHSSVFNCPTHDCSIGCQTTGCQTISHCPHTGWQCRAV